MDICTLVAVDGEVPVAQMEPAELPKIRYHTYTHFHTHIHPSSSEIRLHSSWESLDERPSGAELKNRNTGSRRFGSRVE